MKVDQLTHFLETARHEHIGRAARILHISPSAISHSISRLEEELGQELFRKEGKRITLTPHGRLLAERAEQVLKSLAEIKNELSSATVEWTGSFELAATHTLLAQFLIPAWAELKKVQPQLVGQVTSLRSAEITQKASSGELDWGLAIGVLPHPGCHTEVLLETPLLPVTRARHPLQSKKGADRWTGLSDFPCASPKAFQGIEICENHPALKQFGIQQGVDLIFDSYEAALSYVASSNAWALVPAFLLDGPLGHNLKTIEPKGWKATTTLVAVTPRKKLLPLPLRQLTEQVRRKIALSRD